MNEMQRIKFILEKTEVPEKKSSTFTKLINPKDIKRQKKGFKRQRKEIEPPKKF